MNNKYQEALDSLYDEDTFDKNVWGFVYDGDNLSSNVVENARKFYKDTLQELVDKATPMKPNYEADGYADGKLVYDTSYCPNCNKEFECGNICEYRCFTDGRFFPVWMANKERKNERRR